MYTRCFSEQIILMHDQKKKLKCRVSVSHAPENHTDTSNTGTEDPQVQQGAFRMNTFKKRGRM